MLAGLTVASELGKSAASHSSQPTLKACVAGLLNYHVFVLSSWLESCQHVNWAVKKSCQHQCLQSKHACDPTLDSFP